MKIVNLSPIKVFPPSDGGSSYIVSCLKRISEKNEVILICPKIKKNKFQKNIMIDDFLPDNITKFFNFKLAKKLRLIKKNNIPLIVDFPWFAIILKLLGVNYQLRVHNIEFLRFKSYKSLLWPVIYIIEFMAIKNASKLRYISNEDFKKIKKIFKIKESKGFYEEYVPDK